MLMPEYFHGKEGRLLEIYQELEDFILEDIASRLMAVGKMTGTADREIWKLEQMGMHRAQILKKLAVITGKSERELKAILQDAVMTSWEGDCGDFAQMGIQISSPLENPAVISVLDAQWRKAQGELYNLTQTTMLQSQRDLVEMLDKADMRVAAGVQSYSSAICQILDEYAQTGIMIDYPTGARRSLEAAVRCCVVTSMNQTAAQVTNKYIAEHGIEYVLISAHYGARHDDKHPESLQSHDWWQGHVFKINGRDEEFGNLLECTGYDIDTATGTGKTVNMLGLHGYNCRHSHGAWQKGMGNPWIDESGNPKIDREESEKRYRLEQKQRAMERAIRETKRRLKTKLRETEGLKAAGDEKQAQKKQAEYDRLAYRLQTKNKEYNDFCKDNGLAAQYDRNKAAGFNRRHTAMANERAAVYKNGKIESGSPVVNKITDRCIARIPEIRAGNLSDEQVKWMHEKHRELLYDAEKSGSNEVAKLFNESMEEIKTVYGTADEVDLNISGRTTAKYVMHNHPNNASFSDRDIAWLMKNRQVSYFSIVKNSGDVEIIHIPENFNIRLFMTEYKRSLNKYRKIIEKDSQSGYNKMIEELLTKTKSGLEYVR